MRRYDEDEEDRQFRKKVYKSQAKKRFSVAVEQARDLAKPRGALLFPSTLYEEKYCEEAKFGYSIISCPITPYASEAPLVPGVIAGVRSFLGLPVGSYWYANPHRVEAGPPAYYAGGFLTPFNEQVPSQHCLYALNCVSAGTAVNQRVGRRIEMQRLDMRISCAGLPFQRNGFPMKELYSPSAVANPFCRFVVVYDRQPTGSAPSLYQIISGLGYTGLAAVTTDHPDPRAGVNINFRDRFALLADKTCKFPAIIGSIGSSVDGAYFTYRFEDDIVLSNAQAGEGDPEENTFFEINERYGGAKGAKGRWMGEANDCSEIEFSLNLDGLQTYYSRDDGVFQTDASDIATGALYLLAFTNIDCQSTTPITTAIPGTDPVRYTYPYNSVFAMDFFYRLTYTDK
jgi:hypothetical protein